MMKRDLKADLGWIQKVTKTAENAPSQALNRRIEHVFVEKAREGWPRAIERAIEAEVLNRELVEVAEMLLQWWNNGYICQDCPNPSGPARTCISECCSILDDYRQAEKKLIRAKEVLGDG